MRRLGNRKVGGHVVAVAYDGKNTESDYLSHWQILLGRGRFVLVPYFVSSGGNPLAAVKTAHRLAKKDGDIDELWCVCDIDETGDATVAAATAYAQANGIRLCLSNRSFEIWISLHFERSDAPIVNEAEAVSLVERFFPNYGKNGKIADFAELLPRTDTAIANGHWLREQGLKNPATDVHELAERLQQLLRRQRPLARR